MDRRSPPTLGPAAEPSFPSPVRGTTGSGLEVLASPRQDTPLVVLRLLLPAGGHYDPAGLPGLASFAAALLEEGTESRTSAEIADRIEALGGSLGTGAGWNSAAISIACLAEHVDTAMGLVAEIATTPAFASHEVDRLRRERVAEWLRRRDQPSALAEEAFAATVYGDRPYGHPLLGDRASLEAIDGDRIRAFWNDHVTLPGCTLLAAGGIDPDTLLRLADSWDTPTEPRTGAPAPPRFEVPAAERRVVVVDRPASAQTELRIGHAGPPRKNPDRPALKVANSLLGGKFTSRINLNLRERNGYTYGAHSAFVDRLGPGPFQVWTAVANDVAGAATREILHELERMCSETVTDVELDETRTYLSGVFPYGLQTLGGRLQRLQELAVYELEDDYYALYLRALRAVSADDILQVCIAHLQPEAATIVAVGPAAELVPQLEGLGPVELHQAFDPAA